jgi:hypothetical protein
MKHKSCLQGKSSAGDNLELFQSGKNKNCFQRKPSAGDITLPLCNRIPITKQNSAITFIKVIFAVIINPEPLSKPKLNIKPNT